MIGSLPGGDLLRRAHTLDQTMKNKIDTFLDRGEIRDCFPIEFLLWRGIELTLLVGKEFLAFQRKLARFKGRDFMVNLGSILESDIRDYYTVHRFGYLEEKLASLLSRP